MSPDLHRAIFYTIGQCLGILIAFGLVKMLGARGLLGLALGAGVVYYLIH